MTEAPDIDLPDLDLFGAETIETPDQPTPRQLRHAARHRAVGGLKRSEIHEWARETAKWDVETRQIDRYIAAANKHLDEQADPHRERELAKAIRRLDMLFARAFKVQDYKTCLAIAKEHVVLLNLGETLTRGPKAAPAAELKLRGSCRGRDREKTGKARFIGAG